MTVTACEPGTGARRGWRGWVDPLVRWGGLALGVAISKVVDFSSESDVDLLYAVLVFSGCAVLGVLAADRVAYPVGTGVRMAALRPRRARDLVPVGLRVLLGCQALLLVVVLAAAAALAVPDEAGRAGRAFMMRCGGAASPIGPWPGPHYAWPSLGGLAGGSILCALALRRVAVWGGTADRQRVRARAVVMAWGLLVCVPLFAASLTMAVALLGTACGAVVPSAAMWGLGIVALVSAITAGWCLCGMAVPQAYVRKRP